MGKWHSKPQTLKLGVWGIEFGLGHLNCNARNCMHTYLKEAPYRFGLAMELWEGTLTKAFWCRCVRVSG